MITYHHQSLHYTFTQSLHYTFAQAQHAGSLSTQANISMADAVAGASNAKHWMQMKNAGRTSGDKNMLSCSHFYLKSLLSWSFLLSESLNNFRIRMQRGGVRWSLRPRLGEEWGRVLLVEQWEEELDWRWGLLPEGRRTFGLCPLRCSCRLRLGGNG